MFISLTLKIYDVIFFWFLHSVKKLLLSIIKIQLLFPNCFISKFSSFSVLKFFSGSSLHNIILNAFRLDFLFWSLLLSSRAFSFPRHSCSKKVLLEMKSQYYFRKRKCILSYCLRAGSTQNWLWRVQWKSSMKWKESNSPTLTMWTFHLLKNFFEQLWRKEEKALLQINSLHNTKTTRNVFNIKLWRLLRTLFFMWAGFLDAS